jgi:hypothetical protein
VAAPQEVNPQQDERSEDQGVMTSYQDLVSPPQVTVDSVTPQGPQAPDMAVIRVNDNIEEMTYSADGHTEKYEFLVDHRYRVPTYIAQELENVGKLYH